MDEPRVCPRCGANTVTEWFDRGNVSAPDPDLIEHCSQCGWSEVEIKPRTSSDDDIPF